MYKNKKIGKSSNLLETSLRFIFVILLLLTLATTVFADDGDIFRKNVSKAPENETEHAALKMLPLYVPPQSSDGALLETVDITFIDVDADGIEGTTEDLSFGYVRPLIAFYTDGPVEHIEEEGYGGFPGHGERDAFGAISLDDGTTWNRTNLSNSASESSFKIKLGGKQRVPYPGDVGRTFIASDGNQVLAVWVSRFAGGGNPNYAMTEEERTAVAEYLVGTGAIPDAAACTDEDLIGTPCLYLEDHFAVAGSQGSSDLADEGLPLVGELPYAAVWAARGVLLPPAAIGETSTFVWFKAERLSSAVRDANRPEVACAKGAGCAITWQEDPDGIRPGEGEGPGEGWSGAIAHHQTDTWYSYIDWDDFALVSDDTAEDAYGTFYKDTGDLATWVVDNDTGRPKAAVPISIPVRLTDNSMCVAVDDKPYCYVDFDGSGTADFCADSVQVSIETPEGPTQDVDMCITEDGRLMRGNTASTRARVSLHEYSSDEPFVFGEDDNSAFFDTIDSAWFSMSYEENKGLGEDGESEILPEDPIDKIDMGKNVWYHTFDMFNPELVSQGLMLNQPAVYEDDYTNPLSFLSIDTSLGYNFYDIEPDPIYETQGGLETTLYQTEISRRPSPISQDWYNIGETGTVAFQLWKQGIIRRGGPADIMGRRFVIDLLDFDSTTDNPYDYANMECETWAFTDGTNPRYVKGFCANPAENVSANTILEGDTCSGAEACRDAFPFNEYFDDLDMSLTTDGLSKILTWEQYGPAYGEILPPDAVLDGVTNFDDPTWENPYDVAKGHRGFLNGDMLMVMYAWSPNWMANTVGHDNYNLYNRRSFDGGETWSTTPTEYGGNGTTTCEWMGAAGSDTEYPVCTDYAIGDFEQARNVSQLVGTRVTILDPRYSPTPPSITEGSVSTPSLPAGFTAPLYDDDIRNPSVYFMVYETGDNTTVAVGEAEPLDLFYSRAINWGDDYQVWADEEDLDNECLPSADAEAHTDIQNTGFCNEFDSLEGSQFYESGEASVTTNPSGRFFYAVWNQIDFDLDGHEVGSDAWFRRVLYWFTPDFTIPTFTFPTLPPVNEAPTIFIDSPVDGNEFVSGETIIFSGTAEDFEDGDLSSEIVWEENGISLGTGASFSAVLTDGTHIITASVVDGGGKVAEASITVTVGTDEPPAIVITSPVEGDVFTTTDTINFLAVASDHEDDDLTLSEAVVWTSDIDGLIGTGSDIQGSLNAGEHIISATVTDSNGNTTSASVGISVTPNSVLSVDVDVSPSLVTKGDTVFVTASVSDGYGTSVEGATVSVLFEFPSGLNISKVGLTDATGTAEVSYKINSRTGTDTAYVTITATKTGYEEGIGETSFDIQ